MRKLIILAGMAMLALPGISQITGFCGTTMSESQLSWLRDFQLHYTGPSATRSDLYYVPLKVHIVGNDDGSGYISVGTVLTDICNLNSQYAETGFYFYLYGDIDYINSSDYYTGDFTAGQDMMINHSVDNAVNLFFVGDPAGNCGYYSPYGDAVALANSCSAIGNGTIAHEIGHFFSLVHTFNGWEYGTPSMADQENVDGSNCNSAGDGFCDTPPDYLAYRWYCPGPVETDPEGQTFQSDGTYFMSYSNDACMNEFSGEQMDAMRADLNGPRHTMLTLTPPAYVDLDSVQPLLPDDGITYVYPNYAQFSWEPVANASAYVLQIAYNASFTAIATDAWSTGTSVTVTNLLPERNYFWRVKAVSPANTCAGYSVSRAFSTGAEYFYSAIDDLSDNTSMHVFPNPAASSGTVRITCPGGITDNALLMIFDITGKTVFSSTVSNGSTSGNVSITLPEIPEGMYILQLTEGGKSFNRKIIVSK